MTMTEPATTQVTCADARTGALPSVERDFADQLRDTRLPDWDAGCSCGWRGAGEDVEDHPCPLPDPMELLDCCGHPRERHYGEYGDGIPACEYCDCSVRSW